MKLRLALAVLCLIAIPLIAQNGPPLQASLTSDQLSFSNVTPGGQLVLFGASIRSERGMSTLRRFSEVLADGDRDGTVLYQPRGGVPFRSIWVAVDVRTGNHVVATQDGYELIHQEVSAKDLKHDSDAAVGLLEERLSVDLVLIRPGDGAWSLRAREGGNTDGDKMRDGRLTLLFGNAHALDPSFGKAPKHLKRGDVLAAIDTGRLELLTLTVTK